MNCTKCLRGVSSEIVAVGDFYRISIVLKQVPALSVCIPLFAQRDVSKDAKFRAIMICLGETRRVDGYGRRAAGPTSSTSRPRKALGDVWYRFAYRIYK